MEPSSESQAVDDCEIPLDEDEQDDGPNEEHEPPKQLTAHQLRMQQLLLKMNQARQLNRQAVQEEGSSQMRPAKSLSGGNRNKDKQNPVASVQAADAIQKAQLQADRQEAAKHSMHDYHNAEAQHRQYERSIKSIRSDKQADADTSTFDPLASNRNKEAERQGAHRLAQELQRRNEKKRKNEAKKRDKEEDVVGHIDKRNKNFVKKLERNYKEHVKEIQQNLERGTAL